VVDGRGWKSWESNRNREVKGWGDSEAPRVARIRRNLLVPAGLRQNRLSVHYFRVGSTRREGWVLQDRRLMGPAAKATGRLVWWKAAGVGEGVRILLQTKEPAIDAIENPLVTIVDREWHSRFFARVVASRRGKHTINTIGPAFELAAARTALLRPSSLSHSFSFSLSLLPSRPLVLLLFRAPTHPRTSTTLSQWRGWLSLHGSEPLSRAESPLRCGVTSPLPRRRCLLRAGSSFRSSSSGARASGRPFGPQVRHPRENWIMATMHSWLNKSCVVALPPPSWRISSLFEVPSKIFISNLRILWGTSRNVWELGIDPLRLQGFSSLKLIKVDSVLMKTNGTRLHLPDLRDSIKRKCEDT